MKHVALSGRFTGSGLGFFLVVFVAQCLGQDLPTVEAASPPQATPSVADVFAVRTWAPAPAEPEVVKVVKPKRPQVPQLPFRFIGKIAEPDKPIAFLLGKDDRILSVSVGDAIGDSYLVEKYEGAHLYFIYKPMKARQSLFVGSAS